MISSMDIAQAALSKAWRHQAGNRNAHGVMAATIKRIDGM